MKRNSRVPLEMRITSPNFLSSNVTRCSSCIAAILSWYDRAGRSLPWRQTCDAYPILVSEVMLQQTQVPRVIPKFAAWLERFPDWAALGAGPTADVIRCWSGLGYNRRALRLQEIARHIAEHGLPTSEEGWRELPGIGAYTAAALAVFALRVPAAPIDTNIRRIGGRLLLGEPFPGAAGDPGLRTALLALLTATPRFSDVVQALFDLASLVCRPRPVCGACPLRPLCPVADEFLSDSPPSPPQRAPARERRHQGKPHPDRIYRGRILELVVKHPEGLPQRGLGRRIDGTYSPRHDRDWLDAMITRLEHDGLLRRDGARLRLG